MKDEIRKRMRKMRDDQKSDFALRQATRPLTYLRNFKNYKHWLLYAPIQNEISTEPIFDWLRASGLATYFPKVNQNTMDFYEVKKWAELKPSKLTPEPSGSSKKFANFEGAIALIPGVAFSSSGHRLGYGRGFYDRYLTASPQILRVGLAFDFQLQLADWETESHDERMDYILTPSALWSSKRSL